MNKKLPYLDENEKNTYKMCLNNIQDKLKALLIESEKERPYRYYIKEKIDSILKNANYIKSMTEQKTENE